MNQENRYRKRYVPLLETMYGYPLITRGTIIRRWRIPEAQSNDRNLIHLIGLIDLIGLIITRSIKHFH